MIWSGRRYHMVGDMNPIAGITLSFAVYIRVLLVCLYIKRPPKSVMLRIRGKKKQNNPSSQRTPRGDLKVWRLIKFVIWYNMHSATAVLSLMTEKYKLC